MTLLLRCALGALACLLAQSAQAHEFWMLPGSFHVLPGQATTLSLAVGQDFHGDAVAFAPDFVVRLRHLSAGGDEEVTGRTLPGAATAVIPVRLATAGTHLFALDTQSNFIELPADKFNEYLRLEGLQSVLAARERAGTTAMPGRERYRRNVKTLVQAGSSDATYTLRAGQRLELVPQADAYALRAPAVLPLLVLFDGAPLPGALVKLWTRSGGALQLQQGVSDAQGTVRIELPRAGVWMASVVHMVAAAPESGADWESFWGNLTFSLGGPR